MNEYLYEMIKDLPDDEFSTIWFKHKVRKSEGEEDEILCMQTN